MVNMCRGTNEDFEDIIDFANYVFSQSSRPHDFKKFFPKLYGDDKDSSNYHYLMKEDNKIKAMVCVVPVEMKVLHSKLKTASITQVCVHPYSRGKGYMKALMYQAVDDMRAQGVAFAFLGGQRQRYEYYGFEPAGVELDFTVTKTNLKHFNPNADLSSITIMPFLKGKTQWIDAAYSLFEKQQTRAVRSHDEFAAVLYSWASEPYFVLNKGEFEGYVSVQANGTITEVLLKDPSLFPQIMKPLFSICQIEALLFETAPYDFDKILFLSQIAELCVSRPNQQYIIFDWVKTIQVLLQLKSKYEQLAEGTLIIGIENKALQITICGNEIIVEYVSSEADFNLSSSQATSFLFSSLGEILLNQYAAALDNQKRLCAGTWFPLPLFAASADRC